MADALSGRTARRQYTLAAEAQADQRRRLAEERARVDAVEAGQRKLLNGGAGGLLAYIDSPANDEETALPLKKTLGGERA